MPNLSDDLLSEALAADLDKGQVMAIVAVAKELQAANEYMASIESRLVGIDHQLGLIAGKLQQPEN